MAHCSKKDPSPSASLPPKGKAIAPFDLTNQDGQATSLGTYAGHVWVANFVFTTCPSICPEVTKAVAELQKTLDEKELKAKLARGDLDEVEVEKLAEVKKLMFAHFRLVFWVPGRCVGLKFRLFHLCKGDAATSKLLLRVHVE